MAMLARLIKAVIGAALINKTFRKTSIAALAKSVNWLLRPSTISRVTAFFSKQAKSAPGSNRSNILAILFKGAAELILLRFAKRGGLLGPAALSALVALLLGTLRERGENSGASSKRQKDQIIDHDDFTILDDRH
jgi:hypothetical protein